MQTLSHLHPEFALEVLGKGEEEKVVQPKRQKKQQDSPAQDDGLEESVQLKLKGEEPDTAGTEEEIVQQKR